MIPLDQYPHLPHWFTLRQAIAEMRRSEFDVGGRKSQPRVVLVFNEEYQLLGMARRRDLLRGLEPTALSDVAMEGGTPSQQGEQSLEECLRDVRKRAERPVEDVMVATRVTADVQDDVMTLINLMVKNDVHIVPVLKEGSVVGVVRTVDLLDEVDAILED